MKRSLLAVLCLALSAVCITTSQLAAAPHYGDPWKFKQPDGSLVDVRVFGDEYYQVVETPDGYTLMRDPSTQWIVYATLSSDGNELRPTNVRYGGGSPALAGVSPHIRINPDAARLEREVRATYADRTQFVSALEGAALGDATRAVADVICRYAKST